MNPDDLVLILPALLAGTLVLATHVPFGAHILQRGVIFADLAVAQIAGLGVILAGLLGWSDQVWRVQLVVVTSALCGAALLTLIERRWPAVKEALIGLAFVLAATLGILLMSHDVHAGEHLQNLLVGQILWVSYSQLGYSALLSALLLFAWQRYQHKLGHFGFYTLFAFAITASVQLVGVYLVFASLIVPALATHRRRSRRLATAYLVGLLGYAGGLLLSVWQDLPAGAAIVWIMALLAAGTVMYTSRTDPPHVRH